MNSTNFPVTKWSSISPVDAAFHSDGLAKAKKWLDSQDNDYRVVIVRGGAVVAEWNRGIERARQMRLASAAKSLYSCVLALAIEDGKISSADAKVVEYYPEMMDVPADGGPKPGRYVTEKDRDITFRQLISNTSGYMKPDEKPGQVFHYQTYGMNILCHAIAKTYGRWEVNDPEGSPGLEPLFERWFRRPLNASWSYYTANFDLQPSARLNIFGYYDGILTNALDMARLGWLWLNGGKWGEEQLIPQGWISEATRAVNVSHYVEDARWTNAYGLGFWTNEHGSLWPDLTRDSFAASGAGRQHIWVCPSLDLVVVHSPGIYGEQDELGATVLQQIVNALING